MNSRVAALLVVLITFVVARAGDRAPQVLQSSTDTFLPTVCPDQADDSADCLLQVVIRGPGYFQVRQANEKVAYTRNGRFKAVPPSPPPVPLMVPAQQLVLEEDLEQIDPESLPVIVQRQSRVDLTARLRGMEFTTKGEALQDGRLGETIRVRNIDSQKVITGRVLSASEVEVTY